MFLNTLHLVGSYTPVPVPAAAWLFASGLAGLLGMTQRKRKIRPTYAG